MSSLNEATHVLFTLTLPPTVTLNYMNESWILESSQLSQYPSEFFSIVYMELALKGNICVGVGVKTGDRMPCLMGIVKITSRQFENTAAKSSDIWIILNMKIWRQSYIYVCLHIHTHSHEIWPIGHVLVRILQINRTNRRLYTILEAQRVKLRGPAHPSTPHPPMCPADLAVPPTRAGLWSLQR